MAQKRKSLRRSNRKNRKTRRRSDKVRGKSNGMRNVFEWSSILPKASIKTKTRFNLKNDWGLKVKGVLNL
jgi:hypothetical protein